MKTIITSGIVGVIATALSMATEPVTKDIDSKIAQQDLTIAAHPNTALLNELSVRVTAKPEQAADFVKQTIIQTKANAELVLHIVKTAVLAAPEQAEAIRKVALALAPDAEKEIEMVIAAVLQGDQVAAAGDDGVNAALDKKKNASHEPEGKNPKKNTVWLTNKGALLEGKVDKNTLSSHMQDYASSPNQNHNSGAIVRGGSTVVGGPSVVPPTTPLVP